MRGSRILAELVMSNYSVAKGILDRMVLSLMKGVRPEYLRVAIDRNLHMYRFLSEGADEAVSQLKSRLGEEEFRGVDPDLRSFFNINTRDDYRVACELMGLEG